MDPTRAKNRKGEADRRCKDSTRETRTSHSRLQPRPPLIANATRDRGLADLLPWRNPERQMAYLDPVSRCLNLGKTRFVERNCKPRTTQKQPVLTVAWRSPRPRSCGPRIRNL